MANFTPQEIEQFLQEFFDVVGTRQYVGARYVPIFGRKGEDTVEWDNLAPYEPLSVVMHEGVSYVSRQYVPKDVDITNTDYWVETYRFNAQVEQYRQEVLGFQDQIDDKVPYPDPDYYPKFGTLGQVLSSLADGTTKWDDPVQVTADIAEPLIEDWLDNHPEATTTVQDQSITPIKTKYGQVFILRNISVSDCDTAPANALVRCGNASQSAHAPSTGGVGDLLTLRASTSTDSDPTGEGTYSFQLHFGYDSHIVSIREWNFSSETWNAWRNIVQIPDASVGTSKLANQAVTSVKAKYGQVFVNRDTTISDCDTAPANAIVRCTSSETAHTPSTGGTGELLTLRATIGTDADPTGEGNFALQLHFGYDSHVVSIREWNISSSAWGAWRNLVQVNTTNITDHAVTAVKAKYGDVFVNRNTVVSNVGDAPANAIVRTTNASTDKPPFTSSGDLLTIAPTTLTGDDPSGALPYGMQLYLDYDTNTFYNRRWNYTKTAWDSWNLVKYSFENFDKYFQNVATKIAFVGDSITAGQNTTGFIQFQQVIDGTTYTIRGNSPDYPDAPSGYVSGQLIFEKPTEKFYNPIDGNGYAQQLIKLLKERKPTIVIDNYAFTGATLENMKETILPNFIQNGGYDIVFFMGGTNNRGNASTLYQRYAEVLRLLKDTYAIPMVVAITPPPISPAQEAQAVTSAARMVYMENRELGIKPSIMPVHLFEKMCEQMWLKELTYTDLFTDGIHPNDDGATVMYRIVANAIGIPANNYLND